MLFCSKSSHHLSSHFISSTKSSSSSSLYSSFKPQDFSKGASFQSSFLWNWMEKKKRNQESSNQSSKTDQGISLCLAEYFTSEALQENVPLHFISEKFISRLLLHSLALQRFILQRFISFLETSEEEKVLSQPKLSFEGSRLMEAPKEKEAPVLPQRFYTSPLLRL